VMRGQVSI